jgi:PEGA domain/PKD domain
MSRSSLRIPAFLRSSVSLALAATMVVGAGAAESPKGSAGAAGALSITTEPDNADVYVDGRLAGQTPANLAALSAGEHRVRLVKSGYLENARIVTLTAGEPSHLNVKLTKTSGVSSETAAGQVTSTGGGGGGSKKWLWIGLAGAGAAAVVVAAMPHNKAPVPGTITVSPNGTGMAGQTSFTFTSTGASDPDGDSLTKTWTSSDGGSGTGDTFTRTFASAGSFNVTLKVSDGKLDASTPAVPVTVAASMTANWTGGVEPGFANSLFSVNLTQSGTSLSGTMVFSGNSAGSISVTGTVSGNTYPTTVNFTTPAYSIGGGVTVTDSFSGTTDGNGSTMTGTVTARLTGGIFPTTGTNTATGQSTFRR